jgi:hypothetical protein
MASSSKQNEPIPITALDPQQLMNIRSRMEDELQQIATSAMQLNKAANLFQTSKTSIEELVASEEGAWGRSAARPSLRVPIACWCLTTGPPPRGW